MNRLPALQKLADQIADTEQQLPDSVSIILRDIKEDLLWKKSLL